MTRKAWIITGVGVALTGALLFRRDIQETVNTALDNPNVHAFLKAIRYGEGTSGANGYRTLYGGGLFSDMSDHPAITGEWAGVELPDDWCIAAGYSPGCITTAAGAYQITRSSWIPIALLIGLFDFSPESQDLWTIEKLRQKGALQLIISGDIIGAMNKVKNVWASIPGSTYGQPTSSQVNWLAAYANAGGEFAAVGRIIKLDRTPLKLAA